MRKTPPKAFYLLSIVLSISSNLWAQDIVTIHHQFYTSWFSQSEHIPLVVTYTLTSGMVSCGAPLKRTNRFTADPDHSDITSLNKDYRNSGYDRGHNMSAADNECNQQGMKECFYFSNMTPQPHFFNAGRWEDLEKMERTEALKYKKIVVTVGSVGVSETIGQDKVAVPKYMWKVIYIESSKTYQCYIFPDTDAVTQLLSGYKTTLSQVENLGNVNFNNGAVELQSD